MNKINCNVIKDILPLYVDDLASEDTKALVESHLKKCDSCMEEYRKMANVLQMPIECVTEPIEKLQKKWRSEKILTTIFTTVISLVVVLLLSFCLFFYGVPASEESIGLTTEFQINRYGYLNQEYVFHFTRLDNKNLNTFFKNIYEKNEQGEKVLVGYEVQIREPIINLIQQPKGFTFGYMYQDASGPDADFDFTVTIKYKDSDKVYSMREEGLFVPQENLGGIDFEGLYGR